MKHRLADEEARFRKIFRAIHAEHPACLDDEWLGGACRLEDGSEVERPIVWSRRNGAWRRVEILWVGAAPGNAGGKGDGRLGAHGTRIPFGGDISGANVDVLLGSIGLDRNDTFIIAALNQLPARGGGEPTVAELNAPVGAYPTSLHLLRDTVLAAGPRLVVVLGTIAVRATIAALRLAGRSEATPRERITLPGRARLERAGVRRGHAVSWPTEEPPDERFLGEFRQFWGAAPLPSLLWLTHPSAQNMSPFAGTATQFHARMLETRDALRRTARDVLGRAVPEARTPPPDAGIYALPEWREHVAPRHARLTELWREKGV